MKPNMLAYTKLILKKVSFSKELYEREYRKALKRLSSHDAQSLKQWNRSYKQQLMPVTVAKKY